MEVCSLTTQYLPNKIRSKIHNHQKSRLPLKQKDIRNKVYNICKSLIAVNGVHSIASMEAAGLNYTNDGDAASCKACGLVVSNWTLDMKPISIHIQRSPTCPLVCSLLKSKIVPAASTEKFFESQTTDNNESSPKRQKIEINQENYEPNAFSEVECFKQARQRTFSHWADRGLSLSEQMIEAGFFGCNVGDRVICLYCNLICQQWVPNIDDPCQIHKKLSPKCPYVIAMLKRAQAVPIPIINGNSATTTSGIPANNSPVVCEQVANTMACNNAYKEIPKRYASFETWSDENAPSVDDLVQAGFFYTGVKTIVTCFYCNGSLQNWGANDNPTIEHARWYPHCSYIKQLCGDELYRKIQTSNQRRKEADEKNKVSNQSERNTGSSYSTGLDIPNENTLSRLVAARLDLPNSQRMLDLNFKLSVIKRCWEDQLRMKRDDFISDTDLLVACNVLQKQIEYIDGKKENIIIPTEAMKKIREKEEKGDSGEETVSNSISINLSDDTDVEMTTSTSANDTTTKTSSVNMENKTDTQSKSTIPIDNSSLPRSCALCLTEEKCLACMPCGHVATCVSCGHSLRSCPICRSEIKAFVRVYL